MATPTYDLIDSVTLASPASSITFSGISGDYRDLIFVANHDVTSSTSYTGIRFNDDSGTNYQIIFMGSAGTTAFQGTADSYDRLLFTSSKTNADEANLTMHIMDYAQTNKNKPLLIRQTCFGSNSHTVQTAGNWNNTAALTKIQMWPDYGLGGLSFSTGSSFYLFGVAA
jgi:hypothetical protein